MPCVADSRFYFIVAPVGVNYIVGQVVKVKLF